MSQEIVLVNKEETALLEAVTGEELPFNLSQNPAAIYLASLRPTGRRAMKNLLNVIAEIASSGRHNVFTLPWHELRYQHTSAFRTALQERYKPASVNMALSALRQVLKEAWQLGQMSAEDYHRAANHKVVRNQSLPRGRALKGGELVALMTGSVIIQLSNNNTEQKLLGLV